MNVIKYNSNLKKTPYYYYTAKIIAKLINDGLDRDEVYKKCFHENVIQIDSLERRREVTNIIYNRLVLMDKFLLDQFLYGDVVTSKFLLVYAVAKSDPLFFEFLFEVYREALLNEKHYISLDDFETFFIVKRETNERVKKWSDNTIDQLGKGYRNILVESGLGTRERRNIEVNEILVNPDVIKHIKLINDEVFLKAIIGA